MTNQFVNFRGGVELSGGFYVGQRPGGMTKDRFQLLFEPAVLNR